MSETITVAGWQAHLLRGSMSGSLKKQFVLEVISERAKGWGRSIGCRPSEERAWHDA